MFHGCPILQVRATGIEEEEENGSKQDKDVVEIMVLITHLETTSMQN